MIIPNLNFCKKCKKGKIVDFFFWCTAPINKPYIIATKNFLLKLELAGDASVPAECPFILEQTMSPGKL